MTTGTASGLEHLLMQGLQLATVTDADAKTKEMHLREKLLMKMNRSLRSSFILIEKNGVASFMAFAQESRGCAKPVYRSFVHSL